MHRLAPLLLLLVLAGSARADDEELLTVQLAWEPSPIGSVSAGRVPFKDEPPPGIERLPGLRISRYARIRMADSKGLLVAMDADEDNVRLWVDHDFDGELKDEVAEAPRQGDPAVAEELDVDSEDEFDFGAFEQVV